MERITDYKAALDQMRPLSGEQIRSLWPMWDKEDVLYVQTSNAIEGNTLTLAETTVVVEQGVTIGGKTVKEHLEAINGVKAYHLMLEMARNNRPITRNTIFALHEALLADETHAGAFRTDQVFIRGAMFVPPATELVPNLVDKALDRYAQDLTTKHPVVSGAKLAFFLVTIHPFTDGNGRISRLLNNLHLIQYGYPPVLIDPAQDKPKYFEALAKGQNREDPFDCDSAPFVAYMIDMERRALERYVKALHITNGRGHEDPPLSGHGGGRSG